MSTALNEVIKIVGAILWLVGIPLLILAPPVGFLVLLPAIVLSVLSIVRTRRARHEELLAVSGQSREATTPPPEAPAPTADARLAQLQSLLDNDTITQAEYDQKRQSIIHEL